MKALKRPKPQEISKQLNPNNKKLENTNTAKHDSLLED